jgi:hypothetical protein
MSLLSGLVGITKLASNFIGGGAGSKENTSQSSSQSTSQKVTGNQSSSTASTQSANRREFSDGFLQQLELVARDALGSQAQTADVLRNELTSIANNPIDFDADAFVKGVTDSARTAAMYKLDSDINATVSATGGSTSGNSAAALLANRLRNETGANLAGINANARGTAAQIESGLQANRVQSITGITDSVDKSLTSLLAALRGAETQQDTKSVENMVANSQQTATGQTLSTGKSSTSTPFNWAKGFGNLFGGIDQDE